MLKEQSFAEKMTAAKAVVSAVKSMHDSGELNTYFTSSSILINSEKSEHSCISGSDYRHEFKDFISFDDDNGDDLSLYYKAPELFISETAAAAVQSSLYSLGVILYELFTGQLPFNSDSANDIIHSHIAVIPVEPSVKDPLLTSDLSDMIMKLLAKEPEDRYSSAAELLIDLEKIGCVNTGTVKNHGNSKLFNKLNFNGKMYGRERELEICREVYRKTAEGGAELILVSGEAGIGKTAFVKWMVDISLNDGGIYGYGKFSNSTAEVPYSAVADAFGAMIKQLLTESDKDLEKIRGIFRESLEPNGGVITSIIPEFELLIGKQPELPDAGPVEAKNRFLLWFTRFAALMADYGGPAVLFLDDLQWSDSASIELLKYIISGSEISKLLVICSFRDSDEYRNAELNDLAADLVSKKKTTFIHLTGLTEKTLTEMVSDLFKPAGISCTDLVSQIFRKTSGVPFYVIEYLKEAIARGALSAEVGLWQCDNEKLASIPASEGLAAILAGEMKKIPEDMKLVLAAGACAGWSFSVELIAAILRIGENKTKLLMQGLCEKGYILNEEGIFRFIHDKVREAAYSLIPENDRQRLHRRTGRVLYGMSEDDDSLFRAVEQMNLGIDLIAAEREKIELASLNFEAGIKARKRAAFTSALSYLSVAYELLPRHSWKKYYELTSSVIRELAEAEYIDGNYERSEVLISNALDMVKTDFEKVDLINLLVYQNNIQLKSDKCLELCEKALKILSYDFEFHDINNSIVKEKEILKKYLESAEIQSLCNGDEISNKRIILVRQILKNLSQTAYFIDPQLLVYTNIKMLVDTLKHGISKESISAFSSYAAISEVLGEEINNAYEFFQAAYRLSEKYGDYYYKSDVCVKCGNFVIPWKRHLRESDAINREGAEAGFISGEIMYAIYSLTHKIMNSFNYGKPLHEIMNEALEVLTYSQKNNYIVGIYIIESFIDILNLLRSDSYLSTGNTIEEKIKDFNIPYGYHLILRIQYNYLFNNFNEAFILSEKAERLMPEMSGLFISSEFFFYYSLTLAAFIHSSDIVKGESFIKKINENQNKMKAWAGRCPENFLHKYLLVEAELASMNGDVASAMDFYKKSIESASEQGYVQNEALANELAGRFWLRRGYNDFALLHIERARERYEVWGAARKVKLLDDEFPSLKKNRSNESGSADAWNIRDRGNSALVKSLQAISGEIELESLLCILIKNMLQYEGGTRIALILEKKGSLFIEAEGYVDQSNGEIKSMLHKSVPVDECTDIPVRLIRYCARSRRTLIINDVLSEELPVQSEYLKNNKIKSVLCMRKDSGTTSVVVYIENSLLKNVFTIGRVEVLKLLAVQAAISIENARLFREKEEAVERLAELNEAGERLLRQYEEARHKAMIERANPHFLYNAIHTIHALIKIDPAAADRGTLMLAEIMKFLTDRSFEPLVTLEDEMRFVEFYLAFEKIRFPDTLSYTISIEGNLNTVLIPPLSVQPLVGNAIKHGLRKKTGGGRIDIKASVIDYKVIITVSDTGAGINSGDLYSRTLGNIKGRLGFYFNDAELEIKNGKDGGAVAEISFTPGVL